MFTSVVACEPMSDVDDYQSASSCQSWLVADTSNKPGASICETVASISKSDSHRWLADAPRLLSAPLLDKVASTKALARRRRTLEAGIPRHLLFTKGWPTTVPTFGEATRLAAIRAEIGAMFAMTVDYAAGRDVVARYEALLVENEERAVASASRAWCM